ncbi:hypothetical protein GE061_006677 [Apolygus lucorum]|uniref:Major facilitator superfamily (MFS) profile domain-containing protein n=1 Tax=Apolygus lucorum TaxID=248454 RepID=A0A6A4J0S5_APOLU|nr:hypothetical protein GE061_006677 [Apolygus lucorum]
MTKTITTLAIIRQVWLAVTASLGYLTIGLVRGWSSPAIPSMREISPNLAPDDEVISWISAVPPLGAFVGSLFCGPMMQGLGRKKTLLISSPLFAASWLIIGLANHWGIIIAARAFSGFCVGIVLPSAQIYVSECSHPRMRGMMGSLPALAMAIGILVSYILGTFLSWYALSIASAAFPASLVVLLQFLPESPTWLQTKGRTTEAKAALEWLQRESNIATVELSTIEPPKEVVTALPSNEEKTIRSKKAIASGPYSLDSMLRKPVLVPFGLAVGILVFQQVSGIDSIVFYTVSIFKASGSTLGEYESTIIVGAVQVVATIASVLLVDAQGRKALLLISGVTMAVSMAALGAYFYLLDKGKAGGLGLLPLFSQLVFIVGYSLGYCNIPFILMGELLPIAQRSLLSSVAGALNLASMFVVIKTFPDLVDIIGSDGTFWLYACLCALSCAFVHFFLPETKGKSLDEIEELFEKMSSNPRIKTAEERARQPKQDMIVMH